MFSLASNPLQIFCANVESHPAVLLHHNHLGGGLLRGVLAHGHHLVAVPRLVVGHVVVVHGQELPIPLAVAMALSLGSCLGHSLGLGRRGNLK